MKIKSLGGLLKFIRLLGFIIVPALALLWGTTYLIIGGVYFIARTWFDEKYATLILLAFGVLVAAISYLVKRMRR